jgi:hypothetical protein
MVDYPLKVARSLDGIISYLAKKHGGNVHEKGIVTLTSKSSSGSPFFALWHLADQRSIFEFSSKDAPGQWVCWDFHEMRVRPTHYTIRTFWLRSWIVEGSVDGRAWTKIDERNETRDFEDETRASFAASHSGECRFIRVTQTGRQHSGDHRLTLRSFEFFGTLQE